MCSSHNFSLLNAAAASLWDRLWRASWQGALAVLLVWGICRALPRLSPRAQCWLWRLAYLKFLVALLSIGPFSIRVLPPRSTPIPARPSKLTQGSMDVAASWLTPIEFGARTNAPQVGVNSTVWAATSAAGEVNPGIGLIWTLMALWALGVAWRLGVTAREWRALRRLRSSCGAVEEGPITERALALCQKLTIRRIPALLYHPDAGSPMLLAGPVIVLPSWLMGESAHEEASVALAHELAHLKRLDLVWNVLPAVTHALFFFHPILRLARQESRLAQELATDEVALGAAQAPLSVYGALLLKVAAEFCRAPHADFAAIGATGPYQMLRRRLIAMRFIGRASRTELVGAALAVMGLGLIGVVPWRLTARETPTPPRSTSFADPIQEAKGVFRTLAPAPRSSFPFTAPGHRPRGAGNDRPRGAVGAARHTGLALIAEDSSDALLRPTTLRRETFTPSTVQRGSAAIGAPVSVGPSGAPSGGGAAAPERRAHEPQRTMAVPQAEPVIDTQIVVLRPDGSDPTGEGTMPAQMARRPIPMSRRLPGSVFTPAAASAWKMANRTLQRVGTAAEVSALSPVGGGYGARMANPGTGEERPTSPQNLPPATRWRIVPGGSAVSSVSPLSDAPDIRRLEGIITDGLNGDLARDEQQQARILLEERLSRSYSRDDQLKRSLSELLQESSQAARSGNKRPRVGIFGLPGAPAARIMARVKVSNGEVYVLYTTTAADSAGPVITGPGQVYALPVR